MGFSTRRRLHEDLRRTGEVGIYAGRVTSPCSGRPMREASLAGRDVRARVPCYTRRVRMPAARTARFASIRELVLDRRAVRAAATERRHSHPATLPGTNLTMKLQSSVTLLTAGLVAVTTSVASAQRSHGAAAAPPSAATPVSGAPASAEDTAPSAAPSVRASAAEDANGAPSPVPAPAAGEDPNATPSASHPAIGDGPAPLHEAVRDTDATAAPPPSDASSSAVPAATLRSSTDGSLPAVEAPASTPEDASSSDVVVRFRPGSGLSVASADGQYSMVVDARLQLMALAAFPQGIAAASAGTNAADDPQLGVAVRRARIILRGNLFGPETIYKIELGLSPQDMGFTDGHPSHTPLMDWYVEMRHLRDLHLRLGQFKVPYGREFYLSAGRLQMVDLSAVTGEFNLDRDIGFQISSPDLFGLGLLRYRAGITTGEGRDAGFGNDFGLLYFARVDVLPFGLFDDMTEADLERLSRPRLSIGAAYAFLDNARRMGGVLGQTPTDGGTTDYHFFDADLLFLCSGFSVLAQFFARSGTRTAGNAVDSQGNLLPVTAPRNGVGWFVQAGYVLPGIDLEIAGRYGMTEAVGAASQTSFTELEELGGAVSYYFGGHAYKVQLDFFQLWNGFDNFGIGQQRIRLQLTAQL